MTGRCCRAAASPAKVATGNDDSGWPPAHSRGSPVAAPAEPVDADPRQVPLGGGDLAGGLT